MRTLPRTAVDEFVDAVRADVPHAAHHVHLLTVDGGLIAADTVLCGGRWPSSLLAEMAAGCG